MRRIINDDDDESVSELRPPVTAMGEVVSVDKKAPSAPAAAVVALNPVPLMTIAPSVTAKHLGTRFVQSARQAGESLWSAVIRVSDAVAECAGIPRRCNRR